MFRAALKPVGGRGLNNPTQRGAPLSSLPRRVAWVHPAGFGWLGALSASTASSVHSDAMARSAAAIVARTFAAAH